MQKLQGWAEKGNITVSVGGLVSTTKIQGSFPLCTVTIYISGTINLASIFSDNAGSPTPKANPFVAESDGGWSFYAADGRYDVKFTGTGITVPFTLSDFQLADVTSGIVTVESVTGPAYTQYLATLGSNGSLIVGQGDENVGNGIFDDNTFDNYGLPYAGCIRSTGDHLDPDRPGGPYMNALLLGSDLVPSVCIGGGDQIAGTGLPGGIGLFITGNGTPYTLQMGVPNKPDTDGTDPVFFYSTSGHAIDDGFTIWMGGFLYNPAATATLGYAGFGGRSESNVDGQTQGYAQVVTANAGNTRSEKARWTSTGVYLVGKTSAYGSEKMRVFGSGLFDSNASTDLIVAASAGGAGMLHLKASNGTVGLETSVTNGQVVGDIFSAGYSNAGAPGAGAFFNMAGIRFSVSGAVVGGQRPGSKAEHFVNAPNGAQTVALTLDNDLSATFAGAVRANASLGINKAPSSPLDVTQTGDSNVATINNSHATFSAIAQLISTTRAANAAFHFLNCKANNVEQFVADGAGNVFMQGKLVMTEISAPAAPSANGGVLYLDDNGAGKTRLNIRFNTGAVQVIATEP